MRVPQGSLLDSAHETQWNKDNSNPLGARKEWNPLITEAKSYREISPLTVLEQSWKLQLIPHMAG